MADIRPSTMHYLHIQNKHASELISICLCNAFFLAFSASKYDQSYNFLHQCDEHVLGVMPVSVPLMMAPLRGGLGFRLGFTKVPSYMIEAFPDWQSVSGSIILSSGYVSAVVLFPGSQLLSLQASEYGLEIPQYILDLSQSLYWSMSFSPPRCCLAFCSIKPGRAKRMWNEQVQIWEA